MPAPFDAYQLASARVDAKRLSANQRDALLNASVRMVYVDDQRTGNALRDKGMIDFSDRLTDKGRAVQHVICVQQYGMGKEEYIAREEAKRNGRKLRKLAQRANRVKMLSTHLGPIMDCEVDVPSFNYRTRATEPQPTVESVLSTLADGESVQISGEQLVKIVEALTK